MNILFVMRSPGYIRNYENVLQLFVERGHRVRLAFDQPGKYAETLSLGRFEGRGTVVDAGKCPKRKDKWSRLARQLRSVGDYVRYLDPRFASTEQLRRRMERKLPAWAGWLRSLPVLPGVLVKGLLAFYRFLEDKVPSDPAVESFIRDNKAEMVLVTPLVTMASEQTEIVKSARALGLPTVLCVGSWDHLTTKGLIRGRPDKVLVWNERQKQEAMELHSILADNVIVTGAQLFDQWFDRRPSSPPEAFRRRAGLDPDKPYVLFVGSTISISPPEREVQFVRRWVASIRQSTDRVVSELGVLIRPHPYNAAHWSSVDLSEFSNVAVWQHANLRTDADAEEKALYFEDEGKAAYFDSIYHSAAVVGVNSSALIESAIIDRPIFTVLAPEFKETQIGTLHFRYLLPENGGFLNVAETLEEHRAQLNRFLSSAGKVFNANRRFVEAFVRPHGLDRPSAPIFVDAVENIGRSRTSSQEKFAVHAS